MVQPEIWAGSSSPVHVDLTDFYDLAGRMRALSNDDVNLRYRASGIIRGAMNKSAKKIIGTAAQIAVRGKDRNLANPISYYSKVEGNAKSFRVQAGRSKRLHGGNDLSNYVGRYSHYPHFGESTSRKYGRRDWLYLATLRNLTVIEKNVGEAYERLLKSAVERSGILNGLTS